MLRKTALIAFVAAVLSLPLPVWNAIAQTIEAIGPVHPWWIWLLIPVAALAFTATASKPAFCLALYRNEGALRLSKSLRLLSLAAAIALAGVVALESVGRISSFGGHLTMSQVSGLLGEFPTSHLSCYWRRFSGRPTLRHITVLRSPGFLP